MTTEIVKGLKTDSHKTEIKQRTELKLTEKKSQKTEAESSD